jgi:hypothetical protein
MNLSQELQNFLTHQVDAYAAFADLVAMMRAPSSAETNCYFMSTHFEYLYNRDECFAAKGKLTLDDLQTLASMESAFTGESFEVDIRFRKQQNP